MTREIKFTYTINNNSEEMTQLFPDTTTDAELNTILATEIMKRLGFWQEVLPVVQSTTTNKTTSALSNSIKK